MSLSRLDTLMVASKQATEQTHTLDADYSLLLTGFCNRAESCLIVCLFARNLRILFHLLLEPHRVHIIGDSFWAKQIQKDKTYPQLLGLLFQATD